MLNTKVGACFATLLIVGCASDPITVQYQAPETSQGDWFPIPTDAPSSVELVSPELPRAAIAPIEISEAETQDALSVEWLEDSLGNVSLKLNRQPGAAWELIESALEATNTELSDKNRDEYMFVLENPSASGGLFGFFAAAEPLKLVLIPQGRETIVAVEGADEVVVEREEAEETLSRLLQHFEQNG